VTNTIHLGVVDVRYDEVPVRPESARRRPRGGVRWRRPKAPKPTTKSTGDVAEILEHKYGLFSMFTVLHGQTIADALEEAMAGKLETLMMGGPTSGDTLLTDADLGEIEQAFKKSIDDREYDSRLPGVPTRAALNGVDHRLKHPYSKGNPSRPSFRDTGLMQTSFKAWVD